MRRRAPVPGGPRSWREASYCVVDLETTGLDARSDEILSYAAVPIESGRILAGAVTSGFVHPRGTIPASSIRCHGIRPADVEQAPDLDHALDDLLTALAGRTMVAHVEQVERRFLSRALRRRGLRLESPILDTARLARAWRPELPEMVTLGQLARLLGVPTLNEHEAVGDAMTTAHVFLALAASLDRTGLLGPQELAALAERSRVGWLLGAHRG